MVLICSNQTGLNRKKAALESITMKALSSYLDFNKNLTFRRAALIPLVRK